MTAISTQSGAVSSIAMVLGLSLRPLSLLRVVVSDLDAYRRFQAEKLVRIVGVQSVKTEIPLQRIKVTAALPL